ncbi:MAG TPA: Franean1_4349 family RiPP [Polyangium sp.]|nr:Franean1_4349 family RiPP [Polyangium sp.]
MAGESKKKSVEDLIGHALGDKSFRDRLLASPEATLEAEGYEVTPEVIQAIKSANLDDLTAFEQNSVELKAAG